MASPGKKRRGRGEGSVTFNRAKNLYQASIQVGLDERGRARRQYVRAKRKEVLLEKLRELQNNYAVRKLPKPTKLTVAQYLDRWLEDTARPIVRFGTYQNYRGLIKNKIQPYVGGYRLVELSALHLQQLFATLERLGNSPYRRQQVHSLLYSAFRRAVELQLVSYNPCAAVRSPRIASREIHILDELQASKLLSVARKHQFYALFMLALATGMRQGELFGLKWSDVDLKARTLSVQRTVVSSQKEDTDGKTVIHLDTNDPKTKKGKRLIELPFTVIKVLRQHHKTMLARGTVQWVFCDSGGGLLRRSNFNRRVWKPLLVKVANALPKGHELPTRFRFHDLRHTAASLRLAQGDHPKVVQELLGHSKISITLDLYSHVMPSLQVESAEKLDRVLKRISLGS